MKRFVRVISLFLATFIVWIPVITFGHSGRTDGKGGHWSSASSEYHYHHGYPAHQHYNGVCLYDLKGTISIAATLLLLASLSVPLIVINRKAQKEKERERQEAAMRRENFVKFYSEHTLRELCGMPNDTYIGKDGMPAQIGTAGWGDKYTRYCSPYSKVFHTKTCRYTSLRHHVFDPCMPKQPCLFCHPDPLPDRKWFDEYQRHLKICKREGITPKPDIFLVPKSNKETA